MGKRSKKESRSAAHSSSLSTRLTTNKPVIYTLGVFDLFHKGHVNYLQDSISLKKKVNGYLIVGVQTDESVWLQKCKPPIIKLDDRLAVVKAIAGVDEVLPYYFVCRGDFLLANKVEYLVVSKEYGASDIEQNRTIKEAIKLGIKVVRVPRYKGISSTKIRAKIASRL